MGSGNYLEIDLYLEDDEQVVLTARTRDKETIYIPNVVGNPVRYYGVWSIPCLVLGKRSSAFIPADEVRYLTVTHEERQADPYLDESFETEDYLQRSRDEFRASECELVTLENTQDTLWVHRDGECAQQVCSIHNRSDHAMRDMPQSWRTDRAIMERICEHGIGHPDPDDYKIYTGVDDGVHGCDGCCARPSGRAATDDLTQELL